MSRPTTYADELRGFRASYVEDVKRLRERGLTVAAVARNLSMSERTVYRILAALKDHERSNH